jgi:hypothetical protein
MSKCVACNIVKTKSNFFSTSFSRKTKLCNKCNYFLREKYHFKKLCKPISTKRHFKSGKINFKNNKITDRNLERE